MSTGPALKRGMGAPGSGWARRSIRSGTHLLPLWRAHLANSRLRDRHCVGARLHCPDSRWVEVSLKEAGGEWSRSVGGTAPSCGGRRSSSQNCASGSLQSLSSIYSVPETMGAAREIFLCSQRDSSAIRALRKLWERQQVPTQRLPLTEQPPSGLPHQDQLTHRARQLDSYHHPKPGDSLRAELSPSSR